MTRGQLFSTLLVLMAVLACDQDPFHRSERRIAGKIRLEQWEDGETYYLVTPETRRSGGGLIDGTVRRIGWDSTSILVERHPLFGDSLDWIVIDPSTARIAGPYTPAQLKSLAAVQSIPLVTAESAWRSLH